MTTHIVVPDATPALCGEPHPGISIPVALAYVYWDNHELGKRVDCLGCCDTLRRLEIHDEADL